MQPKHVKEAFRLLNKSIIRVETPDVQFDDDEEEEPQEGSNLNGRKILKFYVALKYSVVCFNILFVFVCRYGCGCRK